MAPRGRKPKPAGLRLIEGKGGAPDPAMAVPDNFSNGLLPPKKLRGRQDQLWRTVIQRCPWLTHYDRFKAFMWIALYTEFERDPAAMTASRIGQLRATGAELGLDPASRSRAGFPAMGKGGGKDEFFDD